MAKLQELGLGTEIIGEAVDMAALGEQRGEYRPLPQPGTYRFRFPARMDDIWEGFDHTKGNPPGKRIRAVFDDHAPLTIIQSPGKVHDGEPFTTRLTNAERQRGKKGDPNAPWVSDMDYIFRDVFGVKTKPTQNAAYAQELQKHVSQEFTASLTWNWFCNPNKNIWTASGEVNPTTGQAQLMEVEQAGCGTSFYMKDVEKVPSNPEDPSSPPVYPERITCTCGANVRAFANLENFRP